jgi:hypothetical protein
MSSPQYLRVRNWEKFQHYKDRRPIWIKYHVELLDDYELTTLDYVTQLLYDRLLLLAARTDNNIPLDPAYVCRMVSIEEPQVAVGLDKLLEQGFLVLAERKRSASKVIAKRSAEASLEKRREETDTEKRQNPPNPPRAEKPMKVDGKVVSDQERMDAKSILQAFNEVFGTSFASREWLSKIVMRLREHPASSVADHRAVIQRSFDAPWWTDSPSPAVVYGNAALFEKAASAVGTPVNGSRPNMKYGRRDVSGAELLALADRLEAERLQTERKALASG